MPPKLHQRDRSLRRRLRSAVGADDTQALDALQPEILDFVDWLVRASETNTSVQELGQLLQALRYWQEALRLRFGIPSYGPRPTELRAAADLEVRWPEKVLRRTERTQDAAFDYLAEFNSAMRQGVNAVIEEAEYEIATHLTLLRDVLTGNQSAPLALAYAGVLTSILAKRLRLIRSVLTYLPLSSMEEDETQDTESVAMGDATVKKATVALLAGEPKD